MEEEEKEEIITRDSFIVSRARLDETYLGAGLNEGEEPIASNLILVPANKMKFNILNSVSPNPFGNVGPVNIMHYLSREFSEHESDLGEYKIQLEKRFGKNLPFAVISHNLVLAFTRKGDSFKSLEVPYDFIIDSWRFSEEQGNGRHFLQLAYVDAKKFFEHVPERVFTDFFNNYPLGTLEDRPYPRLRNQKQNFSVNEEEFLG
mgnify:CR=1 FL=1|jgi:hypothetical protein|tara:strand:+ start:530 stop:1141 length:612 start_codon:yes stop_codon:yes gene_type:complete